MFILKIDDPEIIFNSAWFLWNSKNPDFNALSEAHGSKEEKHFAMNSLYVTKFSSDISLDSNEQLSFKIAL